jgi:hypothetical protein
MRGLTAGFDRLFFEPGCDCSLTARTSPHSAPSPPLETQSLVFSYEILTPAALNFFVSYADGAVESLWSIDQYFQFVLVLMLSTGLSFQVCVRVCVDWFDCWVGARRSSLSSCSCCQRGCPSKWCVCDLIGWGLSFGRGRSSGCALPL